MDYNRNIDIEVRAHLQAGRIYEAIDILRNAALSLGWHRGIDRIARDEENYSLLSRYALDGVADPRRDDLLADIRASLYATSLEIKRMHLASAEPSLYFNTLRTITRRRDVESLPQLIDRYRKVASDLSLAALAGERPEALQRESEELESLIFSHIWTLYPATPEERSMLLGIVTDPTLPGHFKEMAVGAVMLSLLQWLDEGKMMLLADIYEQGADERIEVKAATALLLTLWNHRDALLSSRLTHRLEALRDTRPDVDADLRMAMMQIIRTRDTDRVTRIITSEVIPEMMKLRPDIEKTMKQNPEAAIDPEANPEWEELLRKSGVESKLRELQELQEDGADVMMSTFGNLKSFPFFNDIAHWFTPFHTRWSFLDLDPMATLIESTSLFCDNDKYSFILSLSHIPAAQRKMMEGQIDAYAVQSSMAAAGDSSTAADRRAAIARNFTRDLYRFFKLFRRKGEMPDPFRNPVNPLLIHLPGYTLSSPDLLNLIGEFYFKNRYWDEAAQMLDSVAQISGPTIPLLQKTGYALQQLKKYDEAIDAYRRAEMLGDDSRWLMRRMAAALRSARLYDQALDYLTRLEADEPDDIKLALSIGQTLMKLGRHDQAMKYFHKVEYLAPGKALRPMAWSTFMLGDYDKCSSLTEQILALDDVNANDLLNAGHLNVVTGRYRDAAALYRRSLDALGGNFDRFMIQYAADRDTLRRKGLDPTLEAILLDQILKQR